LLPKRGSRVHSSHLNRAPRGCMHGSSKVDRDVPKLPDLYKRGELKLDELISRGIRLEEVKDALTAMQSGEVALSVIVL
jgi:S-(hydroxymethyl)glutathione dehydrogenase / alcohol dehydrogenase